MPPSTSPAEVVGEYASDPESVGSGRRARRGGLRKRVGVGNKKRGGGGGASAPAAAAGAGADDDTAAGATRHARGCFVFPTTCLSRCLSRFCGVPFTMIKPFCSVLSSVRMFLSVFCFPLFFMVLNF